MLFLSCGVAFAHNAPFVLLGLSLGAWDDFDRRGLSERRKVVNSSLQMRVVVSVNPRRISLLGREAVTVGAAGCLFQGVCGVVRVYAHVLFWGAWDPAVCSERMAFCEDQG